VTGEPTEATVVEVDPIHISTGCGNTYSSAWDFEICDVDILVKDKENNDVLIRTNINGWLDINDGDTVSVRIDSIEKPKTALITEGLSVLSTEVIMLIVSPLFIWVGIISYRGKLLNLIKKYSSKQ